MLHVKQMKYHDMKILHVVQNEIALEASTSCKTHDLSRNENSSCKLK